MSEEGEFRSGGAETIRVGALPYLNVQPLIHAFQTGEVGENEVVVHSAPTARELARRLTRGDYDVAIVPIMEHFLDPVYSAVPGIAIGATGPVKSVAVFSTVPLEKIVTMWLDPASLTSFHLVQVLLAERGLFPRILEAPSPGTLLSLGSGEAQLLIGDPALRALGRTAYFYDLALLWRETTGLPFVFAAWLVHPKCCGRRLNDLFQRSCDIGMGRLPLIAKEVGPRFGFTPSFTLEYFRENICYDLGEQQMNAVRLFGEMCVRRGLLSRVAPLRLHCDRAEESD